jgi:hypothetical protein
MISRRAAEKQEQIRCRLATFRQSLTGFTGILRDFCFVFGRDGPDEKG